MRINLRNSLFDCLIKNYLIKTSKKIFSCQKSSLLLGNKIKHIITDSK